MGLDNGIEIRRTTDLPPCISIFDNGYGIKVAYWRKCWNVRHMIYTVIDKPSDNDFEYELNLDQIHAIIKVLRTLNYKNYQDYGSCIWDWNDFKRINRRNIRSLEKLAKMMKRYPSIIPVFYDSY